MVLREALQYSVLIFIMLALSFSAYRDYKCREVSDLYWASIGSVGILNVLATSLIDGGSWWESVMISITTGTLLYSVLGGNRFSDCIVVVMMVFTSVMAFSHGITGFFVTAAVGWAVSGLFVLCYYSGIIRGGADVKCLVSLTMAIPTYPGLLGVDFDVPAILEILLVPSISVLLYASLFSVFGSVLYCLVRNRGSECPLGGRYCGYMLPIEEVRKSFVWPAEKLVEGKRCRIGAVSDEEAEEIYGDYSKKCIGTMYVTPMIPFIVPLMAATIFTVLFGNPMFLV